MTSARAAALPSGVRERAGAAIATALVVGVLGYLLVIGLAAGWSGGAAAVVKTFAALPERPEPPVRIVPRRVKIDRPRGAAAPPNLRSKATQVVAPVPVVVPVAPPPVIVAAVAGVGGDPTSGAADRAGPGTGAGGQGNGTGSGGSGDGDGSGLERVPRLIKGSVKGSDLPDSVEENGFRGVVSVRYHVEVNGRVTGCTVTRSSGNADIDATTCRVIEKRFRYDPWRDVDGRPVRSIVTREQEWDIEIDPPGRG